MANLRGAIELGDVLCLPVAGQNSRYFYLPLAARLQKNPDGSSAAQLLVAGDAAFLQASTEWAVDDTALEAARRALADRTTDEPPAPVILSFAPVSAPEIALSVQDDGERREIARRQGSDTPPFAAFFSVNLHPEDRAAAMAALNGARDRLIITYSAVLRWPTTHSARLEGRLSGIGGRRDLDLALQDGRAVLTLPEASRDLTDAFLDRAVEMLALARQGADAVTRLELDLTVEEDAQITVGADLGAEFARGAGPTPPIVPAPTLPGGPASQATDIELSPSPQNED